MGFFGIDSTSQAIDNRIGAGDNARINRGSNSNAAEAGGRATRISGGHYVESGGVDFGSRNKFTGGSDLSGSLIGGNRGNLAVTINDPTQAQHLADTFASTIQGVTDSSNALLGSALQSAGDAQAQSLDRIVGLATSVQTGGASTSAQYILHGAMWLGLFGVIGLIAWFLTRRH